MALNIPGSRKELKQKSQTDVQNTLPESNPFLPNSYLDAIITAASGRVYDFYIQLKEVAKELFPDTAEGVFLERWGSYVGVLRRPATQGAGRITITGTSGSIIPINTQLTTTDGNLYQTIQTTSIVDQIINVFSLTRIGQIAIAETSGPHMLVSGQTVTILGATDNAYNGTYQISVTSESEFTYNIIGTPLTPALGTITVNSTFATTSVRSIDFGESTNQPAFTPLTFLTPIAGVNNTARVGFNTISGGSDQENDDDLRDRILFRYQNPVALFNENAIIVKAREVPGVTRVFVEGPGTLVNEIEVLSINRNNEIVTVETVTSHKLEDGQIMQIFGADQNEYNILKKVIVIDDTKFAYSIIGAPASPATGTITVQTGIPNGQVIIYFTRDNDENIIPTAAEVAQVKDALVNYNTGIMPANVDPNDVIVRAPSPITVNFTIGNLAPNSPSMQQAIIENLRAFFRENTVVSQNVLQVAYQAVIFRTIDPETGFSVNNFTLANPIGDIEIQTGEIAILGTVTFI